MRVDRDPDWRWAMYGSVMIGRLAAPIEKVEAVSKAWERGKGASTPGFLESVVLEADDGKTVVVGARFEDKATYLALADDPDQDRWWREEMAPLLDGEPQWIDGTWRQ
jgi:hypothetical protein